MNISIPEPLKWFVDGQFEQGRYSSVGEHMRELIRDDEECKAQEQAEALPLGGLQGQAHAMTGEDLSAIRNGALATLRARKVGR